MKLKEITFFKPVKVLQVFRNINVYGKAAKSFDARRERLQWRDIASTAGYVLKDELYLPDEILKNPDLKTCDLITIEDDNHPDDESMAQQNRCLRLTRRNELDIFEIRKEEEDIELHLQYGYFDVGIPARENFKLCVIKERKPIEIKINGKTDFSMSSRRARVFKEQDYIFEYLGDFDKCKLVKVPYVPHLKKVPAKRKVVDLLKRLW